MGRSAAARREPARATATAFGWSRWAAVGMVAVVCAVSGIALWSSAASTRAAQRAASTSLISDTFQQASTAIAAEESLERKYRLEPTPAVRQAHGSAARRLRAALAEITASGQEDEDDLEHTTRVGILHDRYLTRTKDLFAAVDAGDAAAVERIETTDIEPLFAEMKSIIEQEAAEHRARSVEDLNAMRQLQSTLARTVPVVFVVGLVLAAMFASAMRRYRREMDTHRRRAVHDSLHDPLTGLANRVQLTNRVEQALTCDGTAEPGRVGLILLDVDRFREINEALGHRSGDKLLVQIAAWLRSAAAPDATVARLGGDEFAVLLPGVAGVDDAVATSDRLRRAIGQLVALDSVDLSVEISAGVVVSGEHGDDAATLLQRAEVAMYAAKQHSRGLAVYEPSDDVHDADRLALLADLRRAIDARDLELHYQPKVALGTGAVSGVEALVRWRHPQRGMIPPVTFIPLAEHTALIGPLTEHVLDTALAQARTWAQAGQPLTVSVNLSARNLSDPDLFNTVIRLLNRHAVPAQMLTLELTESAIITEPEAAQRVLAQLRSVGIGLAIDDFGAGYTSLGQLKELPITELKVDRSFVSAMTADPSAAVIVRSVIEMAANLGLSTTAEGVEDADTLDALRADGCDTAQGYHVARPMPAADFDAWRAGWRPAWRAGDRAAEPPGHGRTSVERPDHRSPAPTRTP